MEDMMQHLRHMADKGSADSPDDEPGQKRQRVAEAPPGATHVSPDPGSGAPDEAKGLESRECPLQRVVFIDSTWNQTNRIITDERLQCNYKRLCLCSFSKSWVLVIVWGGRWLLHPPLHLVWTHSLRFTVVCIGTDLCGVLHLQPCYRWSWRRGRHVSGATRRANQRPTWPLLRRSITF